MAFIDLNSDLGEAFGSWPMGQDEDVLTLVSSANVACGFHAGDAPTMVKTCREAVRRGVRIGAHIGYRDLAGFGRRAMDYDPEDLYAETVYQIGALQAIARAAGGEVAYVKPHGALYNRIAADQSQASAVIEGVRDSGDLAYMGLAGTPIIGWAADAGLQVLREAFADRAYNDDGTLRSRKLPGAVHHDPSVAAAQAVSLARGETIEADSICVHGDNPAAVALIRRIIAELNEAGIEVGHAS